MKRESNAVATALRVGVAVSFGLIVLGLLLAAAQGDSRALDPIQLRSLGGEIASGHGVAIIHLGILTLLLTPFARVVVLVGHFARRRDVAFVAVSFGVLLLLITTIIIGLLWEAPR